MHPCTILKTALLLALLFANAATVAAGNVNPPKLKEGDLCGIASVWYVHQGKMVACEDGLHCRGTTAKNGESVEFRCVRY